MVLKATSKKRKLFKYFCCPAVHWIQLCSSSQHLLQPLGYESQRITAPSSSSCSPSEFSKVGWRQAKSQTVEKAAQNFNCYWLKSFLPASTFLRELQGSKLLVMLIFWVLFSPKIPVFHSVISLSLQYSAFSPCFICAKVLSFQKKTSFVKVSSMLILCHNKSGFALSHKDSVALPGKEQNFLCFP